MNVLWPSRCPGRGHRILFRVRSNIRLIIRMESFVGSIRFLFVIVLLLDYNR